MPLLRMAYLSAYRRIVDTWRLELAIAVGIFLAVTMTESGFIYSTILEEAALQRALGESDPQSVNLEVRYFYSLEPGIHQQAQSAMRDRVQPLLDTYYDGPIHWVRSSTFFFHGRPEFERPDDVRPRGKLQYMSGVTGHLRVVQGRFPEDNAGPVEVALDVPGARALGLSLGEEFALVVAGSGGGKEPLGARLVGLVEQDDPSNPIWYGTYDAFSYKGQDWDWVPLFATSSTVFQTLALRYPGMFTEESWFFYLDADSLRVSHVGGLERVLEQAKSEVRLSIDNSSSTTRLEGVLESFKQQALLARVPILLLGLLSLSILMYYLFLVSTLVVRARSNEIAVLKSRGATGSQISFLMLIEGLILAIPALALGPLLALGVVSVFSEVLSSSAPEIAIAPLVFSHEAFFLGLGGALLSVAIISLSAFLVARRGVVHFKQAAARPPTTPLIHRYYLDMGALAIIGFVWWQIQENRSFLVRPLGETDLQIDYTLVLGPVLGFISGGLIALRLVPVLLGLGSRVADRINVLWLSYTLKRLSRDPIVPGALALLVMLATALGVVAATINSSLEASQEDRMRYAVGADLRIQASWGRPLAVSSVQSGPQEILPGAESISLAYRQTASLTTAGLGKEITILAVDTGTFAKSAWHRSDITSRPLDEILQDLRPRGATHRGLDLPPDATRLGVWARPVRPERRASLLARLEDSRGRFFSIVLGRAPFANGGEVRTDLLFTDWQYLSASLRFDDMNDGLFDGLSPPFRLRSVFVDYQGSAEPGAILLDDLTVSTQGGEVVLEDFEGPLDWHPLEEVNEPGLVSLEGASAGFPKGSNSLSFAWASGLSGVRGLVTGPSGEALPALVNGELLEAAGAEVGDIVVARISGISIPIFIAGEENYFPSLYSDRELFAVLDLDGLLDHANLRVVKTYLVPSELWVNLSPAAHRDLVMKSLEEQGVTVREILDVSEATEARASHPLLATGWKGLLVLAFLAVVLASASSVILYSFMDAREHDAEFALLRSFGLSKAQLNGVLWSGLGLLVISSIAAGTWGGYQLGRALLPLLEVAEEGRRVTPPMVLHSDWWTLFWYYIALGVSGLITAVALGWAVGRRHIHRVMRMGEM